MNKDRFCLYSKVRTSYFIYSYITGIVTYFYQLCTFIVILIAFFSPSILSLSLTPIRIHFTVQSLLKPFFFASMRSFCSIYNEAQHNTENTTE